MSFTYDFSGFGAGIAQLRMLVQDNVEETAFLQDEEITLILAQEPNVYRASANACRIIAARLARSAGFKNTTVIYDPTEKAKEYRMLAADLETRARETTGTDLVMGDSIGDFTDENGREKKPAFTRNLHYSNGYTE